MANYAGYRLKIHLSQLFKIPEPLLSPSRRSVLGFHPSAKIGNFVLNWRNVKDRYRKLFDWAQSEENLVAYLEPNPGFMRKTKILNFLMLIKLLIRPDQKEKMSWPELIKRQLCNTDFVARIAESVYGEIWNCENYRYDGELNMLIDQAHNRDSRVTLSNETDRFGLRKLVVNARVTDLEFRTMWIASQQIGRIFAETDIGRVRLESWLTDQENHRFLEFEKHLSPLWHPMGTCRMAEKEDQGVVDPTLKVFGTSNLYVCGSAVFPTYGHANPTLTIVQLALRLARHLG
jgi:hypothetical protein